MTHTKQSHEGTLAYINPQAEKELDKMNKQRHTETPWNHDEDFEGTCIKDVVGNIICEVDLPKIREYGYDRCAEIQQANTLFIVKAVNNHEKLVVALKTVINALNQIPSKKINILAMDGAKNTYELLSKLEQALKEAESEEI